MSCHDIGRGMAFVGREVLRLYDEGKYDAETTKQLLMTTIRGVNWCDGNSYEAAVSLAGRCAHCLRKAESPKEELVFSDSYFSRESEVYDYNDDDFKSEDVLFVESLYQEDKIMAPILCHECLEKLRQAKADCH